MREIKFRAWDKKHNRWTDYVQFLNETEVTSTVNPPSILSISHHDWVLQQFTGLTDKNGKDIYEGDILDAGDRLVTVVWNGLAGTWDTNFISYKGERNSNGLLNADWHFKTTIIGNICENPELLKD